MKVESTTTSFEDSSRGFAAIAGESCGSRPARVASLADTEIMLDSHHLQELAACRIQNQPRRESVKAPSGVP